METINNSSSEFIKIFSSLFISGFFLLAIKILSEKIFHYFLIKISDNIGKNQIIIYNNEKLNVKHISISHIEAHGKDKIVLIPIKLYLSQVKYFPQKECHQ